jgi:C-terminal processing protease CtpA/Prc
MDDPNPIIRYHVIEIFLSIDPLAIDENTPLTYTIDDIRLCTIQRVIPGEVLGICLHYHRHERFHYIKLSADYESTLAFRAGIKSFDRIIEYNGINIEGDSADNLKKKIDDSNNQIIQLLICSPATYAHYKTNKKHLHSNLDTVKRLKPFHDTASKL